VAAPMAPRPMTSASYRSKVDTRFRGWVEKTAA
jgi:hypothetical protein